MEMLFVLMGCLTLSSAIPFTQKILQEWNNFKFTYGKIYSNKLEEKVRLSAFANNFKMVERHNWMFDSGNVTYTMAINKLSDLSEEEFIKYYTCLKESNDISNITGSIAPHSNTKIPDQVDWRKQGFVTPVKDQGDCGSCWAFSATGSLEGQQYNKTKKLVSLSEQNLIDCSQDYGNEGCDGGWMTGAFAYILHNGGIDTEESYPYEAQDGPCRFNTQTVGATIKQYVKLPQKDENSLTQAIASVGPISVAIFANGHFQHYHSGIFNDPSCRGPLNHGVLAVGYGKLNNQAYYLVKNSWGTDWGDQGYIYMSRNVRNQCGIASKACYPLV